MVFTRKLGGGILNERQVHGNVCVIYSDVRLTLFRHTLPLTGVSKG